jgi:hypothetical protein
MCGWRPIQQGVQGRLVAVVPLVDQVLGNLDACRQRLAVEGFVDLGPKEPDEGAGLGNGHVAEGSPRDETPPVVACRR